MSRKIVYNMLVARNYSIDKKFIEENEEISVFNKIDDEKNKIYVFYPHNSKKVGVLTIRNYIKEMKDNQIYNAMIIVQNSVSAFAKKEFAKTEHFNIEYFSEDELLIDITEHVYVPKHTLISEQEKRELMRIYKIKPDKLPKIIVSDPISRYYGAKRGQIFKIERKSETTVDTIIYRLVI